jgi:hypothetical protein
MTRLSLGQGLAAFPLACHGMRQVCKVSCGQRRKASTAKGNGVKWYELIFIVIDMRSFSNLWYWIGLAVLWSSVSHWVMGVPFDMITRARRHGEQAADDLLAIANINARRILFISRGAGLWLIAFSCFLLTLLGLLSVIYDVEFAQAVLLMFAPMLLVGYLTTRTAYRIEQETPEGPDLIRVLMRHRFRVQLIGMLSIFVTSMFGMYQNFAYSI